MPHLVIATTAVDHPMGAQVYEEEIASRAAGVLDGWEIDRVVVRSLRSALAGNRRLPFNHLARAPRQVRQLAGRVIYPRAALVHRMDLTLPPAPHELVTVHDAVAWKFPDEAPPTPHAAVEVRRAVGVICPSSFSAEEAVEVLGVHEPYVIPNGVDERFLQAVPASPEQRQELGIPGGRYVLHAGGSSTRKNLEGLAAAWPIVRQARPDVTLVMSGPPSHRRDRLFGPLDGVVRIGRVANAAMPGLLAAAQVVVVPSTYEGFGLPALEAMAVGVPVVAANRSSLPEVCGDAAVLTEPDGPALAEGLLDVLEGGSSLTTLTRRGRERAAEFTWDRSAHEHAALWRRLS